jgi:hypothetical protein
MMVSQKGGSLEICPCRFNRSHRYQRRVIGFLRMRQRQAREIHPHFCLIEAVENNRDEPEQRPRGKGQTKP